MRDYNKMKFIEDDTCKIFVLQTQAGSESLDGLQTVCNKMVYIDIPLVPKDITQGVGRLLRLMQTKGVECVLAIAEGTIDERLVDMNISKEKSINLVLDNQNKTFEFQDVEFELLNFLKDNNGKIIEDSSEAEESNVATSELG
jgi:SNF2 family DNA or RNA helicase